MSSVKAPYNYTTIDESAFSWFDVHFPPSSFHGRLHVGRRSGDVNGVLRLYTGDREAVRAFIEKMHVSKKVDYYITANTVNGVSRTLDGLFSLDNIVIDIDCHDEGISDWTPYLSSFIWRFKRDRVVPLPNSIVKTGRGLQFWWHINPVYVKCKPYFEEVRDFLILRISEFLTEYEELSQFKVDATSSHNMVGYYRLPCTFNTVSNTKVEFELLREEPYILQDMTKWVKLEKSQRPKKEPVQPKPEGTGNFSGKYLDTDIRLLRDYHTLGFFRMRQLIQLRILRNNDVGGETRNNFCFIAYNAMLPRLGHERAFEKLMDFNKGFKQPMSEKELEGVICSAKEKGGYRYSNEKLIEFLDITLEEQEAIGLWKPSEPFTPMTRISKNASRDAAVRTAREHRNAKILELANKGKKAKEIAKELGLDQRTVSAELKRQGFDRKKLISDMLDAGKEIAEICEETGLCAKTVKKIEEGKKLQKSFYI